MVYTKPQVLFEMKAIRVIEGNVKPQINQDNHCTEENATASAYEADE